MAYHEEVIFFSNEGTRNEVRMRVVNKFAQEEPGEGKGDAASKYLYYVESLRNGCWIYLERPAYLHNGFDFLIRVQNAQFGHTTRRNAPSFDDLFNDLRWHKIGKPQSKKLYGLMEKVYLCHDVTDEEMEKVQFSSGWPTDLLLKTLKWFFIEQDIRYWNYSGRKRLWKAISEM